MKGIVSKDYRSFEKTNMKQFFIAIGLGVLIKRSDALFIVSIIGGLSGLVFDGIIEIINTGSKTKKLYT